MLSIPRGCIFRDHDIPSFHSPPLILASVCRSWRGLAINTPELWSSLHWSVLHTFSPTQKWRTSDRPPGTLHLEEKFLHHLKRSQTQPLDLHISIIQIASAEEAPFHDRITKLLAPHASRLSHFTSNRSANFMVIQRLLVPATRTLRSLSISFQPTGLQTRHKPESALRAVEFPNLRILHAVIDNTAGYKCLQSFLSTPSWTRLHELSLTLHRGHGAQILRPLVELRRLTLFVSCGPRILGEQILAPDWLAAFRDKPSENLVLLSTLQHLHIRIENTDISYSTSQWLFDILECPALVTLSFGTGGEGHQTVQETGMGRFHDQLLESVQSFIIRSAVADQLRNLHIVDIFMRVLALEELLRSTPLLESLSLERTLFTVNGQGCPCTQLMQSLRMHKNDNLLPLLKELLLHLPQDLGDEFFPAFVSMVTSRSWVSDTLDSAVLKLSRQLPDADLRELFKIQRSSDIAVKVVVSR